MSKLRNSSSNSPTLRRFIFIHDSFMVRLLAAAGCAGVVHPRKGSCADMLMVTAGPGRDWAAAGRMSWPRHRARARRHVLSSAPPTHVTIQHPEQHLSLLLSEIRTKYVVKHKSAKLFMMYAIGKLEAALNTSHLILSTSSQRVI